MPLLGKGVLAIWNGIDRGHDDEFLEWHVHEHIPDRIALPGFLRGRRYVALDGFPKYFNFYETASVADLDSPAYRRSLNHPSEWTGRVVRHFSDTSRTICQVATTQGNGEGVVLEALQLTTKLPAAEFKDRLAGKLTTLPPGRGVTGIHFLEGLSGSDRPRETAELQLRGGRPDQTVEWVILIEAAQESALEKFRTESLNDASLASVGALPIASRGRYALQFSLTKAEFEAGKINR
ncbi:hypothetical protein CDEF62S_01168 [Castellaniella defragrans]